MFLVAYVGLLGTSSHVNILLPIVEQYIGNFSGFGFARCVPIYVMKW